MLRILVVLTVGVIGSMVLPAAEPVRDGEKAAASNSNKTATSGGLKVTLAIPSTQPAGDAVCATLTLKNDGDESVGYTSLSHGNMYDDYTTFSVGAIEATTGKEVSLTAFGRRARTPEISPGKYRMHELKPGQTEVLKLNLSLLFDLTTPGLYQASLKKEFYLDNLKTPQTVSLSEIDFKVESPRRVQVPSPATKEAPK